MKGALVILLFTIVVGIMLYLMELRHRRRNNDMPEPGDSSRAEGAAEAAEPEDRAVADTPAAATAAGTGATAAGDGEGHGEGGVCCGMHLVCEKDTLSPTDSKIEYYDDEELDRYIGRDGSDYTPEETEEFQEVLLTMRSEDVTGWARSITQRRINLPPVVRDELLMMVNEQRAARR